MPGAFAQLMWLFFDFHAITQAAFLRVCAFRAVFAVFKIKVRKAKKWQLVENFIESKYCHMQRLNKSIYNSNNHVFKFE